MSLRCIPLRAHASLLWYVALLAVLLIAPSPAAGFFSVFQTSVYRNDTQLPILAGALTSESRVVPRPWAHALACDADNVSTQVKRGNLGQRLMGDSFLPSGYRVLVQRPVECEVLCTATLTTPVIRRLGRLAMGDYHVNLFLDGLPVINTFSKSNTSRHIETGFPLGELHHVKGNKGVPRVEIMNHLRFTVVHSAPDADGNVSIVGFEVTPTSITAGKLDNPCDGLVDRAGVPQMLTNGASIAYTYSVRWVMNANLPFATRWDAYLRMDPKESRVHWFSLLNFFAIVAIQSVALWFILVRTLRRDINQYNSTDDLWEGVEESGWKLIHGDVFRKPRGAALLSVLNGTGCQLCAMSGLTLLLAGVGFVSPSARGLLLTLLIFFFAIFGLVNGFVTAALSKMFRIRSWRLMCIAGSLFPLSIFIATLVLNVIHLGTGATSTLSIGMLLLLLVLWLVVTLPLCLTGALLGFRMPAEYPVKINNIPRTIPRQRWFMWSALSYMVPGAVPFAASLIEISYIFLSVWKGNFYYMFGFLLAVFAMVIVLVAQISVFFTYHLLKQLNYHWWWYAYKIGSSYGVWLFLYSFFYYLFFSTVGGFSATLLYFSYMGMLCLGVSVMMGSVAFLSALFFVRLIYSSVKID